LYQLFIYLFLEHILIRPQNVIKSFTRCFQKQHPFSPSYFGLRNCFNNIIMPLDSLCSPLLAALGQICIFALKIHKAFEWVGGWCAQRRVWGGVEGSVWLVWPSVFIHGARARRESTHPLPSLSLCWL